MKIKKLNRILNNVLKYLYIPPKELDLEVHEKII